jgi:hypothetical protein
MGERSIDVAGGAGATETRVVDRSESCAQLDKRAQQSRLGYRTYKGIRSFDDI